MAILKSISSNLFGWISPRDTHEIRDVRNRHHDVKDPAAIAIAKRKARTTTKSTTVAFHRRSQNSGSIPWQDIPSSSPTIHRSIEEQLAATALEDEEMEDAGDEGAIDTLSDEDDSGLLDEDGDGLTEDTDDLIASSKGNGVQMTQLQESQTPASDVGSGGTDDDDEEEVVRDANQDTNAITAGGAEEDDREAEEEAIRLEREAKAEEQRTAAIDMLSEGWHRDTVELYMLLDRRTTEQLMPIGWRSDFELFPWFIWTYEYEKAFIRGTQSDADFTVIKATKELLKLPQHMRNQIRIRAWYGRRAEAMVVKYCEDFQKLIWKDAGVYVPIKKRKLFSLLCYAPGDDKMTTDELEDIILQRLRKRASKVCDVLRIKNDDGVKHDNTGDYWHEGQRFFSEPPILYGIVVKKAVIVLVAYEPLSSRDKFRTIAFLPMSKASNDVWNTLALAIVMMQCRNELLRMKASIPGDLDALELSDSEDDDV